MGKIRALRLAAEELVLKELAGGPKTVGYLLGKASKIPNPQPQRRTFTRTLERLADRKLIKRVERGKYSLITWISPEEMIEAVDTVAKYYAKHNYTYASLDHFSRDTGIPPTYKVKIGKAELSFEDIVYATARKFGIKITSGPITMEPLFGDKSPLKRGGGEKS
jgi:hypothetical protein